MEMKDRILKVLELRGITKSALAEAIEVSPASVSQMCSGVNNPSKQTIELISIKFAISKNWLLTGEGDPEEDIDRTTKITRKVGQVMRGESTEDISRILNALLNATPEELDAISRFAQRLANEYKKTDDR